MMVVLLAFFAGLLIGSFLNVCIYRLPRLTHRSVATPRSRCFRCRTPIAWYDNIPLLSYALLGGRCRHCHRRIPARYPIVEFTTAVAFAVCTAELGLSLPALKFAVLSAILITLIATDFERHILPDEFTLGGTAVGIVFAAFVPIEPYLGFFVMPRTLNPRVHWLAESIIGAVLASGMIWLIGHVWGRVRNIDALGFGDVKMIAMVGAFLGLKGALQTMILGSLVGAVIGSAYILLARKNWRTYPLPFGSFLGIAALVVAVLSFRESLG